MRRLVVVLALACQRQTPAVPDLAQELARIRDAPDREAEVKKLELGDGAFERIITGPFNHLYLEAGARFDAKALAAQFRPGAITVRRHFAGDPKLTPSQGRLRWVVPVLYPSMVAEIAGRPIDTVFVYDGSDWCALEGIDAAVLAAVRQLDPACADRLALAGPTGHCTEVGWAIAESAMRDDRPAFTHACQLAATLCGTRSP
jgi:hypothetical protein